MSVKNERSPRAGGRAPRSENKAGRITRRSRMRRGGAAMLLGGSSLLAVLASGTTASAIVLGYGSGPVVKEIRTGSNGADGQKTSVWDDIKGYLFNRSYRGVDPTSGSSGPELTSDTPSVFGGWFPGRQDTPLILLQSTGGIGGDGKTIEQPGTPYRQPGGNGGAGGIVTVTLDKPIPTDEGTVVLGLTKDNKGGQDAMISLYSLGGMGGYSMTNPGSGGNGGATTLVLGDVRPTPATIELSAHGDGLAVAWLRSTGGQGGPGSGGYHSGGVGGKVSLTLQGRTSLFTDGKQAPVVIAQSLGGNGGVESSGNTLGYKPIGGGSGGEVIVTTASSVHLESKWEASPGLVAQSIGGKGGYNEGWVGGISGSRGGTGGTVKVTAAGTITTLGNYAPGLAAQSVGGVGGDGGRGILKGGNGGDAGSGGKVEVSHSGTISTSGPGSIGILAQSIGGGRATSAFQSAAIVNGGGGDGGKGGFLFFGSGGDGGSGGSGDTVTVGNSGTILTQGRNAPAILAQSIGGTGGGGGSAKIGGVLFGIALGGDGGSGAIGGTVTVNNKPAGGAAATGSIRTKADYSSGILAQSVGGGGGSGGDATAATLGVQVSLARAVGGNGGKGGKGGTVLVDNGLDIATEGAQSSAITAMSIGGGGGNGGIASAVALSASAYPKVPTITVASAVGGIGGDGNVAGKVTVKNAASLTTSAAASFGVLAMSVGGGGGIGGAASSASVYLGGDSVANLTASQATGGVGGTGGIGGAVEVTNTGTIRTGSLSAGGMLSIGIAGYSIGGGGGIGGSVEVRSQDVAAMGKAALNLTQGIGGDGGIGNKGGDVTISNSGSVTTAGISATGIHGMSVGGGGGNGGIASPYDFNTVLSGLMTLGGLANSNKTFSYTENIGGKGGSGGLGGKVTITNGGSVMTSGNGAAGILAQSIGGGGGKGGGATVSGNSTVTWNRTLGGNGGSGNDGGQVSVTQQDAGSYVLTTGFGAYGIHAQSIGGGGGDGGAAASSAGGTDWYNSQATNAAKNSLSNLFKQYLNNNWISSIKSVQSYANNGWLVKALRNTLGNTVGDAVKGLLLNQGVNYVKTAKPSIPYSLAYNDAVGGMGGAGGKGGKVDVTVSAGSLETIGDASAAVFAQSIGGGGGNGGGSKVGSGQYVNVKQALGGSGGAGGNGGDVAVTTVKGSTIWTGGQSSFGIAAQSIGGGGGSAALGLELDTPGSIIPNLYTNVLGGQNGGGGDGGKVTVTHAGLIETYGDQAHGIVAQSVGGGGGIVMMTTYDAATVLKFADSLGSDAEAVFKSVGLDLKTELENARRLNTLYNANKDAYDITLGGKNVSGRGGTVEVKTSGTISTAGINAFGILAQSVGGGGGLVTNGIMTSAGAGSASSSRKVFVGATGSTRRDPATYGGDNDGGEVKVLFGNGAKISTSGAYSTAVFAQSVGGGGGYGGVDVLQRRSQPVFQDDTAIGNGGAIRILMDGEGWDGKIESASGFMKSLGATLSIVTTGASAHGVFAESLGGGGLAVGALQTSSAATRATQGTGGAITIALAGSVNASGADAFGILAQSGFQKTDGALDPGRSGGKIEIAYNGTITGGSGSGAAIGIDGGSVKAAAGESNRIVIGAGSSISAASNTAILSSFGSESVSNFGTITGDINLATGGTTEWNEFRNEVGGTYISAGTGTINVSNGSGWFYNAGTFSVGKIGAIDTATVKTVDTWLGGVLMVDVNSVAAPGAQNADLLKTAGLTLDGVAIQPHAVEGLLPGTFTVISASSIANNQVPTAGASPASPISWTAAQSGNTVTIAPYATFLAKAGGNPSDTERSLLNSLQTAWNTSDVGKADTFAELANVVSAEQYRMKIESMSRTENVGQSASSQTLGARDATRFSMSCPVFEGTTTMVGESQCVWSRVTGSRVAQFDGGDADGFTATAMSYRVGGQWEFSPDWFLGATAAYNTDWMKTSDGLTSIDGSGGDVSVALKHQMGPWLLAGALSAGYGSYDSSSTFFIGGDGWQALNTSDVWTASLKLRAAYEFAFANWYVRPYADLDVIHTYMPGYTLAGDGAVLRAGDMREWTVAFEPTLEVGARVNIEGHGWLRPYASVGATFIGGNGLSQNVTFSDGGDSGLAFTSTTDVPDTLFDIGAGVQFMANDKYELRGEYKAQIADDYLGQEVSLRMAIRF